MAKNKNTAGTVALSLLTCGLGAVLGFGIAGGIGAVVGGVAGFAIGRHAGNRQSPEPEMSM